MEQARTPVVFVHGLWLHADSWGAWSTSSRGRLRPDRARLAR
jgi:hypothetical protein